MTNSKLRLVGKSAAENGLSRTVTYLSQFTQDEDTQRYQCTYDTLNKFLGELVDCTSSLYSYLDSKNQIHLDEAQLEFVKQRQIDISAKRQKIDASEKSDNLITIGRDDLTVIVAGVVQALGVDNISQKSDKSAALSVKPAKHHVKKTSDISSPVAAISQPDASLETEQAKSSIESIQVPFNEAEANVEPEELDATADQTSSIKRRSFDGKPLWNDVYWYRKEKLPNNYTRYCKEILNRISKKFSKRISETTDHLPFADNAAEFLRMANEYFNVRFAFNRKDGHKFYPELYGEYLTDFCIGYANAFVEGSLDDFRDDFESWKQLVQAGKCKYSAPRSVGWIFRDLSNPKTATPSAYVNKTAVIFAQYLWDTVLTYGRPYRCAVEILEGETHVGNRDLESDVMKSLKISKLNCAAFAGMFGYKRINALLGIESLSASDMADKPEDVDFDDLQFQNTKIKCDRMVSSQIKHMNSTAA